MHICLDSFQFTCELCVSYYSLQQMTFARYNSGKDNIVPNNTGPGTVNIFANHFQTTRPTPSTKFVAPSIAINVLSVYLANEFNLIDETMFFVCIVVPINEGKIRYQDREHRLD